MSADPKELKRLAEAAMLRDTFLIASPAAILDLLAQLEQAKADAVLDQPAQVGGGVFHKGIKHLSVIKAAQRHYQWRNDKDRPQPCPDRWNATEIASMNALINQGDRQFVDLRDYETLQRQLAALQSQQTEVKS